MWYTLNFSSAVCQWHLNKCRRKKKRQCSSHVTPQCQQQWGLCQSHPTGEPGISPGSIVAWFPRWLSQERICLQCGRPGFDPWVGKIPREGEGYPFMLFEATKFLVVWNSSNRKSINQPILFMKFTSWCKTDMQMQKPTLSPNLLRRTKLEEWHHLIPRFTIKLHQSGQCSIGLSINK